MDGPEDFDAFYTATARRVVHHVYALCGDLAEAQDVTQEAYARAWQRWSTVGAYEDPEGWVRTVAWRLTANRWRGLRRWFAARARLGRETPAPGPNPDRVALLAALRRLPDAQRLVVVLHHLHDLPVAEIARHRHAGGDCQVVPVPGPCRARRSTDRRQGGSRCRHALVRLCGSWSRT